MRFDGESLAYYNNEKVKAAAAAAPSPAFNSTIHSPLPRHLISDTLAGGTKGMAAASKTEHCCFDVQHFFFDVFFYVSFHAKFEMRNFWKMKKRRTASNKIVSGHQKHSLLLMLEDSKRRRRRRYGDH